MNFDALRIAYFQAFFMPFRNIVKTRKTTLKTRMKFGVSIY